MIDKLIIYSLIAAVVVSGIWGVIHGENRYRDGRDGERQKWEAVIAETNEANARADDEAARQKAEQERQWAAMADAAQGQMFPPMTADEIARASTPNVIRLEISKIRARKP